MTRSTEQRLAMGLILIAVLAMIYSFLALGLSEMSIGEMMQIEDKITERRK